MKSTESVILFKTKINWFKLLPAFLLPITAIFLLFTSRFFFSAPILYYGYRFIKNTPIKFEFYEASFSVIYFFKKINFTYDLIKKVNFRQNSEESFSIEIDLFNGKFFCVNNQNVFLKEGIFKFLEEKKISVFNQ